MALNNSVARRSGVRRPLYRRVGIIGVLGSLILGLTGATQSSSADDIFPLTMDEMSKMTPEQQAEILDPLRRVANAIGGPEKEGGGESFSGIRLNALENRVDLYLTQPAQLSDVLREARVRDPKADTNLVRVNAAKYTRKELIAAAGKIRTSAADYPFEINGISVASDGSGITLRVDDPVGAKASLDEMRAYERISGDVDRIDISFEENLQQSPTGRYNDWPGYDAAGAIKTSVGECTLGIPAYNLTTGKEGVITAAHCAQTGHVIQNGDRSRVIGWVTSHDWYTDSSYAPADAGSMTWDGWPNNADSYRRYLSGTAVTWYGDWLCQLGSRTGWRCNLFVWDDFYEQNLNYNGFVYNARGVQTVQTDGASSSISGDSGGPVVSIDANSESRTVRGIVSASGWDSLGLSNMFFIEAYLALNAHNAEANF